MHTLRDELRHEAEYQQAWADSETIADPAAKGFVGIALLTADNRRAGGHATSEDFITAAKGALGFLSAINSFANVSTTVPVVRNVMIASEHRREEIPPQKLQALATYLDIDVAQISVVRAYSPRSAADHALHP